MTTDSNTDRFQKQCENLENQKLFGCNLKDRLDIKILSGAPIYPKISYDYIGKL